MLARKEQNKVTIRRKNSKASISLETVAEDEETEETEESIIKKEQEIFEADVSHFSSHGLSLVSFSRDQGRGQMSCERRRFLFRRCDATQALYLQIRQSSSRVRLHPKVFVVVVI